VSERSKKNDHYGKLYYNKPKRWATEYKQKEKEKKNKQPKRWEDF